MKPNQNSVLSNLNGTVLRELPTTKSSQTIGRVSENYFSGWYTIVTIMEIRTVAGMMENGSKLTHLNPRRLYCIQSPLKLQMLQR